MKRKYLETSTITVMLIVLCRMNYKLMEYLHYKHIDKLYRQLNNHKLINITEN